MKRCHGGGVKRGVASAERLRIPPTGYSEQSEHTFFNDISSRIPQDFKGAFYIKYNDVPFNTISQNLGKGIVENGFDCTTCSPGELVKGGLRFFAEDKEEIPCFELSWYSKAPQRYAGLT